VIASTLIGVGGPVMGVAAVFGVACLLGRALRHEREWLTERERNAGA
jgi:hypothetical protein